MFHPEPVSSGTALIYPVEPRESLGEEAELGQICLGPYWFHTKIKCHGLYPLKSELRWMRLVVYSTN